MRARVFSGMLKREASFVKPISLPDSDASHFMLHERCRVVFFVAFALAGLLACERTPDQAAEPKKAVVAERPGVGTRLPFGSTVKSFGIFGLSNPLLQLLMFRVSLDFRTPAWSHVGRREETESNWH